MIGGVDIPFAVQSGPTALDYAVRLVALWWPQCVFAVDDDIATVGRYADLTAFHDRSEVIVYRDAVARDAWDEMGYDDTLKGTMVYLISDPDRLTLVTEHDPCPEIVALTAAIGRGLRHAFPDDQDNPQLEAA